jgi:ADP-dependent NAD(P)H-hydrate dehydratase / NAD(P)H-hydrate epimerase
MRLISPDRREALHNTAATRRLEAASQAALPAHTLMARAGLSVARLARALAPHARCIWVACGPGNNGGDGLVAARHLHQWAQASANGLRVVVTHWTADKGEEQLPADARWALKDARAAGVEWATTPPSGFDLAIDAVFGIGQRRAPPPELMDWLQGLQQTPQPVLCVDVPSLLDGDSGALSDGATATPLDTPGPRHTLSLLTLKPGLFTAHGRDLAGEVWFDDLQSGAPAEAPTAWLAGRPAPRAAQRRPHASHKGSFGDVAVLGGQDLALEGAGMTGAAVLAARAALQAGAGRVFVGLLAGPDDAVRWDPVHPELMFRQHRLLLDPAFLQSTALVCGCGGGSAVADVLPQALAAAPRLVLDADALNALASHPASQAALVARRTRGWTTVLTPHPLEAARLLGTDTPAVMADRLGAARTLAERFQVICVLKGSGTVIAAPGQAPLINPTGNAALATAGTGDVLAGMIGSALALPPGDAALTLDRVAQAVFQHGWLADTWDAGERCEGLRAARLAERISPPASGRPAAG